MFRHAAWGLVAIGGWLIACGNDTRVFGGGGGAGGNVGGTANTGGNPSPGGGPATGGNGGNGGVGGMGCPSGPNDDLDMDGFSPAQGDCDDCEPLFNPQAIEIQGNNEDDNCDNVVDEAAVPCDMGFALDTASAVEAAQTIELCKTSTGGEDWGLVSADWVVANGGPPPADVTDNAAFHLGHGIMNDFGSNVATKAGANMLVLSSGYARRPNDPDFSAATAGGKGYNAPLPAGFPMDSSTCGQMTSGPARDPIGLQVVLLAPSNATGFSFHFDFYAADFPAFVCTQFDDQFISWVDPLPMGVMGPVVNLNAAGDTFSVNGADFDVCGCMGGPPCMAGNKSFACTQGVTRLLGNGFGVDELMEDRGAVGWQRTTVPIQPGVATTVRFATWDMGDGVFSSTALIDDFQWVTDPNPPTVATTPSP
jgi:hypothetical protein